MAPRRLTSRKLLVASVGVATVSYVSACNAFTSPESPSSGNLVAPPVLDQPSPQEPPRNGVDNPPGRPTAFDAGPSPTSGNLVAPPEPPPDPEPDAGSDEDAGSN